jgi:hypothetical protein
MFVQFLFRGSRKERKKYTIEKFLSVEYYCKQSSKKVFSSLLGGKEQSKKNPQIFTKLGIYFGALFCFLGGSKARTPAVKKKRGRFALILK